MKEAHEEPVDRDMKTSQAVVAPVQAAWETDLATLTAQGQTDARMLFSIGLPKAKRLHPASSPATTKVPLNVGSPHTSYLIFATPRSGSYLLCDALVHTNLAGRPTEYFGKTLTNDLSQRWRISNYADYLEGVFRLGTTPNGVFGAKICWTEMGGFIANLRHIAGYEQLPPFELLSRVFPNLQYIWITRRDKVRQAISYWKASWTGEWMSFKDGQGPASHRPVFDFQAIDNLLQSIVQHEAEMQHYFVNHRIQPLAVYYEELAINYKEAAFQALDYLHVPYSSSLLFPEPTLQKQADAQSEEWVQRYYQLKQEQDM